MNHIVPPSLLFDVSIAVPQCTPPKTKRSAPPALPESSRLLHPGTMDAEVSHPDLRVGWHADGLAINCHVEGRSRPVSGSGSDPEVADCVLLWLDMRPSGNVHRATEYCHHFSLLPVDDDNDGKPGIFARPIAQQRAQRVESDPKKMAIQSKTTETGYQLSAWIPGSQLSGWGQIAETRRIGFYSVIRDFEQGDLPLSTAGDFPYSYDPSLWLQLELVD